MARAETDLIEKLRSSTSSTAVALLIPQIEQQRMAAQSRVGAIENAREDAILMGASEREKLRKEAAEAKELLDDLQAASRVADRLFKEFKTTEDNAVVERRMAEARETNKLLRDDYVEIDKLASALGDRLRQAKERRVAIQNANAFAVEAKRPELKVTPILSVLANHLHVTTDMIGTQGSHFVHDPVEGFVLPEYYPQKPSKWKPRLAHLKDVQV